MTERTSLYRYEVVLIRGNEETVLASYPTVQEARVNQMLLRIERLHEDIRIRDRGERKKDK